MSDFDLEEVEYIGIFLTDQSREKLKKIIPAAFKQKSGDHLTIVHSPDEEQLAKFTKYLGKKVILTATHEVVNDRVQAIKIKDVWTERGTPHITISWNDKASPSEANILVATQSGTAIQPWLKLEGYYDVYPRLYSDLHRNPSHFYPYRRNADSRLRRTQRLYLSGATGPEQYIGELERVIAEKPEPESGYEIQKALVLSTSHIQHTDSDDIQNICYGTNDWVIVPHFDYGWWLDVANFDSPERLEVANAIFSPVVVNLMKLAFVEGCDWLRLDSDGPIIETLPYFAW